VTEQKKIRLRAFENARSQRHITSEDRYLYKAPVPQHHLAIIGTGTIGQEHMRVTHLLGRAKIHGIFDIQSHSMDIAAKEFSRYDSQTLVRYESIDDLCADDRVDAILICTPNFTHFDVLNTVIHTGKPIFLEKPMATSLADAKAIADISTRYSSFIQIGLQYRYKAQYVEAFHEALERKTLGSIKTISVSEYRPPFLDKVKQWNKFNVFSGGTLVEKCCHYFDLINLMAQARPCRVFASGGQAVNFLDFEKDGKKSDIDDHSFVIIEYENGVRANFTLNMFCPDFDEEMIVVGERGRLIASEKVAFQHQKPTKTSLTIELGEQAASRKQDLAYPAVIESSGHHGSTYYEHIAFLDQLEGKHVASATVQEGIWAMVVASAAQQSMLSGEAIDIAEFTKEHELTTVLKGQASISRKQST
jgi:myo-inositol 2-dehydrogenase/D-chiro-inositol 1-dehydrogenase